MSTLIARDVNQLTHKKAPKKCKGTFKGKGGSPSSKTVGQVKILQRHANKIKLKNKFETLENNQQMSLI